MQNDMWLLIVTGVSLTGAAGMSIVAWRLLRDAGARSAIRVAALQSAAFASDAEHDDAIQAPAAGTMPRHAPDADRSSLRLAPLDSDDVAGAQTSLPTPRESTRRVPARLAFGIDDDEAPERGDVAPWDDALAVHETRDRAKSQTTVAVSDSLFAAPSMARDRRPALIAAALAIVVFTSGAVYALRDGRPLDALSQVTQVWTQQRASAAGAVPPLELLSLGHVVEPGGAFTVSGLVRNPTDGRAVADATAVVYLFDAQGRHFATGRVVLDRAILRPGEDAPFSITVEGGAAVSRYRVGFRHPDGAVVAHVDRRQPSSAGSRDDTLAEPSTPSPPRGPRSAEG